MRFFLDTSIIVDIDRGDNEVIELCKKLTREHEVLISTVTVSEILTGSYLREDHLKSVSKAKKILGQFIWVNLDGEVAEKVAQINAYLIAEGLPMEFQDVVVAASFLVTNSEFLLTENKRHFTRIPALKGKVFTPRELREKLTVD
ncbi:MAG TPA: type II toxin-antitoxin system VapC family toxin [Candidatus Korarchaeota archaeon]|nr:type II toxin-antitoxin system VapC family toxin [Candidatus Korarchaeota archaeon]